jgi:hypothetical protein
MALASDFSIAVEQVLLTPALKPIFNAFGACSFNPEMTNMAISLKGAKDLLFLQHAKTTKYALAEWLKIRMALAFDFSIAKEQVVLTPALKPIFKYHYSRWF